jgi:hypothetical protein
MASTQNNDLPAGHVYYVPTSERPGDDHDDRRFLLLKRVPQDGVASMAATTTKPNEEVHLYTLKDAGHLLTKPDQSGPYVCGYNLLYRNAHLLGDSVDVQTKQLPDILTVVRTALGMGENIADQPTPRGTLRGRLVEVTPKIRKLMYFRYGFILTEHEYSTARRWQILLPVVSGGNLEATATWIDHPASPEIRACLPDGWERLLLLTDRLVSVTQGKPGLRWGNGLPHEIARLFSVSMDPGALAAAEHAIRRRLFS